jgi:CBS domain-containing protein
MNVEHVMEHDVKACRPLDSLNKAAQLMWENACGCVPVVGDRGEPIGFLTDRDICMAAYTQGRPLDSISVKSSMAGRVVSCHTEDDVTAAINLMRENGVRRLPVVGPDGRLRGIISLDDLACESLLRSTIDRELANRVGEAFLSICTRRSRHEPQVVGLDERKDE